MGNVACCCSFLTKAMVGLLPINGSTAPSDETREDVDDVDGLFTSFGCTGEQLLMLLQILLQLDEAGVLPILPPHPALLPVSDEGLRIIRVIRRSLLRALTTAKVLSNLEKTEKLMRGQ